ncbi:hypothetical protein EBT16_13050, partial [bacterium]|nr:hypothetical protein [bacterium]
RIFYFCTITNNNHPMANKAIQLDKYGLLVSTKISDHDMRIIENLERMLKARKEKEAQKNSWPRNSNGTIWCESC